MVSCILSSAEEVSKVMQIIEKREFKWPRKKCYSVSLKNELWKRNGCPNQLIIQTTSEASVKLQVPRGHACQLFSSCGTPKSYGFWRKKSQTPSSYEKGNMQTYLIAWFYLNIVVKNSYLSCLVSSNRSDYSVLTLSIRLLKGCLFSLETIVCKNLSRSAFSKNIQTSPFGTKNQAMWTLLKALDLSLCYFIHSAAAT